MFKDIEYLRRGINLINILLCKGFDNRHILYNGG